MLDTTLKTGLTLTGLKPFAKKTLHALGLEYSPKGVLKGENLYPETIPPEKFDSTLKISVPQADHSYRPSLFHPTEKRKTRDRINTGLDVKNAFLALYATMRRLGYAVNGCRPDEADVIVGWKAPFDIANLSAKARRLPALILEHGWLPRSSYQISDGGANALSHVAKAYRFQPLNPKQQRLVRNHVARMRQVYSLNVHPERVTELRQQFPEPYILFPFQLAGDLNLRYSNTDFERFSDYQRPLRDTAFAQACIDHLESARLPLPIVFKQHPRDANDVRPTLILRDKRNRLVTNDQKISTLDLFASGRCKLVVSVNSNTLHESLVWNVPVISLGTLLWDETAEDRPLDKELTAAERLIEQETVLDARRLSYLYHVITNQWHLSDFQNPLIVQELLRTRGHCVPYELRCRWGLDLAWTDEQEETADAARNAKIA